MNRKVVSLITAIVLACCLCVTPAYGRTGSDSKEPAEKTSPVEKIQANEKLKADVTKLLADAKAGKLKMPAQHFPQPQRNNLSKGAKIAIVAGIAGAIIFIVLWYTTGPGSD